MNFDESVTLLMHDVARQIRYSFDAEARDMGVTRPQWRALLFLARHEGVTQSELAELLEVERITLCRMIDRLADAGLVERRADPQDRRVWRLHLLPRATEIVGRLSAIGTRLEEKALSALAPAERVMLRESLIRMREALGRRAGDVCKSSVREEA